MPEIIQEIDRFNIKKAENGFVIEIEYHPLPDAGRTWSGTVFATVVAKDYAELGVIVGEWFGAIKPRP